MDPWTYLFTPFCCIDYCMGVRRLHDYMYNIYIIIHISWFVARYCLLKYFVIGGCGWVWKLFQTLHEMRVISFKKNWNDWTGYPGWEQRRNFTNLLGKIFIVFVIKQKPAEDRSIKILNVDRKQFIKETNFLGKKKLKAYLPTKCLPNFSHSKSKYIYIFRLLIFLIKKKRGLGGRVQWSGFYDRQKSQYYLDNYLASNCLREFYVAINVRAKVIKRILRYVVTQQRKLTLSIS